MLNVDAADQPQVDAANDDMVQPDESDDTRSGTLSNVGSTLKKTIKRTTTAPCDPILGTCKRSESSNDVLDLVCSGLIGIRAELKMR